MLDDMKAGHAALAVRAERTHVIDRIPINDVELMFLALSNHGRVQVHAASIQLVFLKQLQPLTTAAAQVEDGPAFFSRVSRSKEGQVELETLFDLGARSTKSVFEAKVEGIQRARVLLFTGIGFGYPLSGDDLAVPVCSQDLL